jgi:hypothetical protein
VTWGRFGGPFFVRVIGPAGTKRRKNFDRQSLAAMPIGFGIAAPTSRRVLYLRDRAWPHLERFVGFVVPRPNYHFQICGKRLIAARGFVSQLLNFTGRESVAEVLNLSARQFRASRCRAEAA